MTQIFVKKKKDVDTTAIFVVHDFAKTVASHVVHAMKKHVVIAEERAIIVCQQDVQIVYKNGGALIVIPNFASIVFIVVKHVRKVYCVTNVP